MVMKSAQPLIPLSAEVNLYFKPKQHTMVQEDQQRTITQNIVQGNFLKLPYKGSAYILRACSAW